MIPNVIMRLGNYELGLFFSCPFADIQGLYDFYMTDNN